MTTTHDLMAELAARLEHLQEAAAESLTSLSLAANMVCETFLQDGKVFICGLGPSAASALLLSGYWLNRYDLERPALPVLNLTDSSNVLAQLGSESMSNDLFAKPIQALAQPQDLLVVFNHSQGSNMLVQAIQAAHQRGLKVLAFSCQSGDDVSALLNGDDLELSASNSGAGAIEVHTLLLHQLCHMVDQILFLSPEHNDD
jgi:D-sedoheptulose 7-phosphate isomerase